MTSPELDNLVKIGKLKREPPSDEETAGLLRSAEERLNDARRTDLAYSSRFDLAYHNATVSPDARNRLATCASKRDQTKG